jgi:hypothetical protein
MLFRSLYLFSATALLCELRELCERPMVCCNCCLYLILFVVVLCDSLRLGAQVCSLWFIKVFLLTEFFGSGLSSFGYVRADSSPKK